MSRTSTKAWPCSIARAVDLLGDQWTLLILRECFYGTKRFDDFVHTLGIGRATLTARLGRLIDEGVLATQRYSEHASRVEYLLTDKGRATLPVLVTLMRWGDDWLAGGDGPPVQLRHPDDGAPLSPIVVDEITREPFPPSIHAEPRTRAAKVDAQRRRRDS